MDNVQLLGHLLEQLPQIKDYLRKHMTDEFEQLQSSCDQFSKYCKDIKMWKSSCSDIYHDELVAIFEAIEGIKSATSNDSVTLCDITTLLNNLRSALNVDFYDGHVIIQGTEEPAEEIEEIEIKSYVDKGRYLKDSEITLKLKNELNAVSLYYSALVGPSLMGKTQTAFTLSHHMTVFYVNCAGSKTEQVICCAMRPIYKLFNGAVSEDRNDSRYDFERNLGTGFFLKEKFKNYKWKTLGLIFTLLKWKSIHPQLDDPEAWFKSFWDIESVVLKPLSVDIFKFKMQGTHIISSVVSIIIFMCVFVCSRKWIFIEGLSRVL